MIAKEKETTTTTTEKYHSSVTLYIIYMTQGYSNDLSTVNYDFNVN
jgi:hypothetical protein